MFKTKTNDLPHRITFRKNFLEELNFLEDFLELTRNSKIHLANTFLKWPHLEKLLRSAGGASFYERGHWFSYDKINQFLTTSTNFLRGRNGVCKMGAYRQCENQRFSLHVHFCLPCRLQVLVGGLKCVDWNYHLKNLDFRTVYKHPFCKHHFASTETCPRFAKFAPNSTKCYQILTTTTFY